MIVAFACIRTLIMCKCSEIEISPDSARNVKSQQLFNVICEDYHKQWSIFLEFELLNLIHMIYGWQKNTFQKQLMFP